MSAINIPGLRGTIYQRGKDSWRVQLSLGRNAQGKYDVKRETIRGRKQDAIDLLTRWNVEYLDNTIMATNHQTVGQAYEEWLVIIKEYRKPNTYRFYKERWEDDILPEIGHKRLKDVKLSELQKIMIMHPTKDKHNKAALSAFYGWCVTNKKIKENICPGLQTKAKPKKQTEDDVWDKEEVRKVYSLLTYENLYDIFIVLGIECGLRPQEILGLTWDRVHEDHLAIEEAVIERNPTEFFLGETKTSQARYLPTTPFLMEQLEIHRHNQKKRIAKTQGYQVENNLVVADKMGHVPDLNYIRKFMKVKAKEAEVSVIPPKNLRTTHISLMNDMGIPLPIIQKQAGHEHLSPVTRKHYIRIYSESLRQSSMIFHDRLHGTSENG